MKCAKLISKQVSVEYRPDIREGKKPPVMQQLKLHKVLQVFNLLHGSLSVTYRVSNHAEVHQRRFIRVQPW